METLGNTFLWHVSGWAWVFTPKQQRDIIMASYCLCVPRFHFHSWKKVGVLLQCEVSFILYFQTGCSVFVVCVKIRHFTTGRYLRTGVPDYYFFQSICFNPVHVVLLLVPCQSATPDVSPPLPAYHRLWCETIPPDLHSN